METSQFHVANTAALVAQNLIVVFYIAKMLAHRLDGANHALVQLKSQLHSGEPHSVVAKSVRRIEGLLASNGVSLVYAGYPYDPLAS